MVTLFHLCRTSAGTPDVACDVCQLQFHVASRINAVFSLMFVECALPSVTAKVRVPPLLVPAHIDGPLLSQPSSECSLPITAHVKWYHPPVTAQDQSVSSSCHSPGLTVLSSCHSPLPFHNGEGDLKGQKPPPSLCLEWSSHNNPAETQDPLPDQATQTGSLQARQPGGDTLLPRTAQSKAGYPHVPLLPTHLHPLPSTWAEAPLWATPESRTLTHVPSGHLHASPTPGTLYLCLLLSTEKPPLLQVPRCLQTLTAITSIVTVPHSNIPLPLLHYPYSKSLPFTAIVLLYCSLLPQSHSPSTGSSSSSIGLSPYTLTVPLQHHSPCSTIIVPYCCGSSSTVKVLPNYYGPHSIITPPL